MVNVEKTELAPGLTSFRADLGVVQTEHTLEDLYQIYKKVLENQSPRAINADGTYSDAQPRPPALK